MEGFKNYVIKNETFVELMYHIYSLEAYFIIMKNYYLDANQ